MITTSKTKDREIAFVLMPEGATDINCNRLGLLLKYRTISGQQQSIPLKGGRWAYINLSQSITEEQVAGIVEKEGDLYVDYKLFRGHLQNYCSTAIESFLSLMESLRLYHKNPLGEKPFVEPFPPYRDKNFTKKVNTHNKQKADLEFWTEAQSRTGNYAVLVRELENQ